MIFQLYSGLFAFIIPFFLFLLPIIGNAINYSYSIPLELLINIILTIIISGMFFGFHLNITSESCNKINIVAALLNTLKVLFIVLLWLFALDYFPSVLEPFFSLFKFNGEFATIVYKSIMIYGVVFLLLSYTNFKSVKDTCQATLTQIKEAYSVLQKELNQP